MKTLSFISPRYEQIAKACFGLLPTIGRITVFYYNEKHRKVQGFEQSTSHTTTPLSTKELLFSIQKERKKGQVLQWVDAIVGEEKNQKAKQLTLTDEKYFTTLCVKIKNATDGNYDLIYIELNKGINQFELAVKKKELSTDNKAIIEKMILNFIQYQLNELTDNAKTFNLISTSITEQRKNFNAVNAELLRIKKNYRLSILRYIDELINKLELEHSLNFRLTDEAKTKLGEYSGSFGKLEQILNNALSVGINLSMGQEEIVIPVDYILFTDELIKNEQKKSSIVSKYEKTIGYLDKYEIAAQKLLMNDMSVNGKNVARFCSPPISAAAITINLKSHALKIQYLFNEYPDKWHVLREHFRPVQNVLKNAG